MSLSQLDAVTGHGSDTHEGAVVTIAGSGAAIVHMAKPGLTPHDVESGVRWVGGNRIENLTGANQVVDLSVGVYVVNADKKVRLEIRRYLAGAPALVPGAFAIGQSTGTVMLDAKRILLLPREKLELFIGNISDNADLDVDYVRIDYKAFPAA